ncbi:MAG TPA: class II D-tagatose-bisphosphate aldolase, non-catalytic subunit [Anaerolineaceae bacterium]
MKIRPLNEVVLQILKLREHGEQVTLLAVCPNSEAVLEAAVISAAANHAPMLFAATLNQVDRDGGYTGWTPAQFVAKIREYAHKYSWDGPLYPCLDHGGPWLKDLHTLNRLPYAETMQEVKHTLTACLEAGYALLHIDPTVDRELPAGRILPVETVVARTIELITHAESERSRLGLPPIAYEVGTEEVHGGLVNLEQFRQFLHLLYHGLAEHNLQSAAPCFIVAQVGTDLHTTTFDVQAAREIFTIVSPHGALAKGHYSDSVSNPEDYPRTGMGGANVGPEFTSEEVRALTTLSHQEEALRIEPDERSFFMETLEAAVISSNRWKKWLQPDEKGKNFTELAPDRRTWLLETGARYIWTTPSVLSARKKLYANLAQEGIDAHKIVLERISRAINRYLEAFNLVGFLDRHQ